MCTGKSFVHWEVYECMGLFSVHWNVCECTHFSVDCLECSGMSENALSALNCLDCPEISILCTGIFWSAH